MVDVNVNPPFGPVASGERARTVPECSSAVDARDTAVLSGVSREPALIDRKVLVAAATGRETPEDHVVEVTDATFDDFLKNAPTPVFMEFYNPT